MSAVRLASGSDIPLMVKLAAREHAVSEFSTIPFDAEFCRQTMLTFVGSMGRIALVSPGGYLLGLVQAAGFSGARIAMEYAWFADDGHGLGLLAAFEKWANEMGAYAVIAHDYTGKQHLAKVLGRRRKYKPMGFGMIKHLEG